MPTTLFRDDPSLFNSNVSHMLSFSRKLVLILSLLILSTQSALGTQTISEERLSAVMAVVTMFLLSEDESSVDLEINDFVAQSRQVSGDFTLSFARQAVDVELCFELSSANASLSINGVVQTGENRPRAGENCYILPVGQQQLQNSFSLTVPEGARVRLSNTGLESASPSQLTLSRLTRSGWDEDAVRKVLRIFAFGGHATSAQIRVWANMRPLIAIQEMLNFDEHNLQLSPLNSTERYRQTATQYGQFSDFVENFLSNPASDIPISTGDRERFGPDGYAFDDSISFMITTRGLNPFRQMVGFWETNYHLAVNLDTNVDARDMMAFYDIIMNAHESGVPYQRVLAEAAKATAPTAQYGHDNNEWINGTCFCNDDFAREIHQLYFGIFGEGDEEHHENVTIPNTASMLTGMKIRARNQNGNFRGDRVYQTLFDPQTHRQGPINILRQNITGTTPFERIDNLAEISIEHPDSLFNLPVLIIEGIADDNLNDVRRNQLRRAWASMGNNKQFLEFIRAYAVSEMFHGPEQLKYMSSFWRSYNFANKYNQYNFESLLAGRNSPSFGFDINNGLDGDDVQEFRPTNNVFGGQTSLTASDSSKIFEDNYNRSASNSFRWNRVECDDCDQGSAFFKEWSSVIPARNGDYPAGYLAEWLWRHMFGNLNNYTELERAHLVSILGGSRGNDQGLHFDLSMVVCIFNDSVVRGENNQPVPELLRRADRYCRANNGGFTDDERRWLNRSYNTEEITNANTSPYTGPFNPALEQRAIPNIVQQLSNVNVALTNQDDQIRRNANRRIHYALAFLAATPFALVEAGVE